MNIPHNTVLNRKNAVISVRTLSARCAASVYLPEKLVAISGSASNAVLSSILLLHTHCEQVSACRLCQS